MRKLIKVNYLGPTNTRGSRVSIKDLLRKKKKIIPYDYSKTNIAEIAIEHLADKIAMMVDVVRNHDRSSKR